MSTRSPKNQSSSSQKAPHHHSQKTPKANTSAVMEASAATPIKSNLTPYQLETLFLSNLKESNRLAKSDDLNSREVVMSKMINYCIRMLHSNGWVPRTVVRSMVHIEEGIEGRTIGKIMGQSLRERRDEDRARRAARKDGEDEGHDDSGVGIDSAGADSGVGTRAGTGAGDGGHTHAAKILEKKNMSAEHKHAIAVENGAIVESGKDEAVAEIEVDKKLKVQDDNVVVEDGKTITNV